MIQRHIRFAPNPTNHNYRIRHKKCDEALPSCSQCSRTGWSCDLGQIIQSQRTKSADLALVQRPNLPEHLRNLTHAEASHFDYFRVVCARDFALCLESAPWEGLLLRSVQQEPSIYHAALAIASLSKYQYHPAQLWYSLGTSSSAAEFSIMHYNMAIHLLNRRLEQSFESSELAILASILFVHIEAFQEVQNSKGYQNLTAVHLAGGLALAHNLKSLSKNIDHLETALNHIQNQIEQFHQYSA